MSLINKMRRRQSVRRDPAGTRQRILDTATALFAEKGPIGASIGDISQASGFNRRMIYHYFGNKEGLYLAVLESVYGRIRAIAIDAADKSTTLAELVDALMEKYFTFLQQNPDFVAMLRWENAEGANGLAQLQLGDFRDRYLEPVWQALRRDRDESSMVEEEEAFFVLLSFLSMCGYYFSNRRSISVVFQQDLDSPERMRRWLDHARQFVFRGLGIEAPPARSDTLTQVAK